jgi:uncharacterized protein YjbI with pentapeptide repeats
MPNVYPGADLSGQDLTRSKLDHLDLRGCNFTGADLSGVSIVRSKLDGAIFCGADLQGANLDESSGVINAQGADFSGASMMNVDLERSWLQGAKFVGVQAQSAAFREANLDRADLSGADLSYAGLTSASLYHATLVRTDLRHAFFERVNLHGADLSFADLTWARIKSLAFDGATLTGASFVSAKTLEDLPEPKSVRAINKHSMYRAYQELLEALFRSRVSNTTHPVGSFNKEAEWMPDVEREGASGRECKGPTKNDKLAYYERCRSKIHCRSLIFRAFDGDESVPPDAMAALDNGVETLQTRLACSEDLARALIMTLTNSDMRAGYGV